MDTVFHFSDVQPTGFLNKKKGHFHNVPEMIPEFVVPDLTDFPVRFFVLLMLIIN